MNIAEVTSSRLCSRVRKARGKKKGCPGWLAVEQTDFGCYASQGKSAELGSPPLPSFLPPFSGRHLSFFREARRLRRDREERKRRAAKTYRPSFPLPLWLEERLIMASPLPPPPHRHHHRCYTPPASTASDQKANGRDGGRTAAAARRRAARTRWRRPPLGSR